MRLRQKRLHLLAGDKRYSLRRVAAAAGIHPSHLSRIERGDSVSLSEEKLVALARELSESPDEILALSGKVASDILAAILERPGFFVPLIRGGANGASFRPAAGVSEGEHRLLETRFNDAQRMTRAGSWDRDLATGKNFWSDEMFRLFGHEPGAADPTLDFFLDHVCPEDRPKVLAARQALLAGPGEVEYRFRFRRTDGLERLAQVRAETEFSPNGIPLRLRGTLCDVTEHLTAVRQARDLACFPRENPNPILRVGGDGVVEYANPAAKALLSLAERTRIDDHGPCRELADLIRSALERDDRREADLWVARRCFQFVAAPCPEHGCANVYGMDITRRVQAESALRRSQDELTARVAERTRELAEANRLLAGRLAEVQKMGKALAESERKYRGLVFGLEVGILTASGDGRVDMVNPKGLALLGLSEETILGRPASGLPLDFFRADGSPLRPEDAPLARVLLTGEPLREVTAGVRRPGRDDLSWVSFSVIPEHDARGNLSRLTAVFSDVGEWLRMEKELLESRERFQFLYRHFPQPTCVFRLDKGDFVLAEANRAAFTAGRGRLEGLLGRRAGEIFAKMPEIYLSLWTAFEGRRSLQRRIDIPVPDALPAPHDVSFVFVPPDMVMVQAVDLADGGTPETPGREAP